MEALAQKLSNEKGKLYALKADVSKENEIIEAFEWIKANLGPVHILVNNAGIAQVSSENSLSAKTIYNGFYNNSLFVKHVSLSL